MWEAAGVTKMKHLQNFDKCLLYFQTTLQVILKQNCNFMLMLKSSKRVASPFITCSSLRGSSLGLIFHLVFNYLVSELTAKLAVKFFFFF